MRRSSAQRDRYFAHRLVNNLLLAANLVTACEGFVMGAKAGIDPDAMLAMVNAGTGRSMVTEQMMEQVLSGRFAFGGALLLLDKDARLALPRRRR